jgi:hypothetical protein
VSKPRPGVDDNYEMYFIFRYAHHVLDIEIVVISVHRIVTYGVQYIISLMYSRARQPTHRSMSDSVRGNDVEETQLGKRTHQ